MFKSSYLSSQESRISWRPRHTRVRTNGSRERRWRRPGGREQCWWRQEDREEGAELREWKRKLRSKREPATRRRERESEEQRKKEREREDPRDDRLPPVGLLRVRAAARPGAECEYVQILSQVTQPRVCPLWCLREDVLSGTPTGDHHFPDFSPSLSLSLEVPVCRTPAARARGGAVGGIASFFWGGD